MNNCKDLMKAMYLDWVSYYKRHGSPRSEKKLDHTWKGWTRTTKAKKLKKDLKQSCDW